MRTLLSTRSSWRDGLPAGGVGLLGELGPAEPELARGHDLPLDEAADVVARRRLALDGESVGRRLRLRERPDLVLDIADRRVGIEPGLVRPAQRGLELGGGLLERRDFAASRSARSRPCPSSAPTARARGSGGATGVAAGAIDVSDGIGRAGIAPGTASPGIEPAWTGGSDHHAPARLCATAEVGRDELPAMARGSANAHSS